MYISCGTDDLAVLISQIHYPLHEISYILKRIHRRHLVIIDKILCVSRRKDLKIIIIICNTRYLYVRPLVDKSLEEFSVRAAAAHDKTFS